MRANWKEIVELVGIVAIVLSLAFVGFQLRQDRDIALAQLSTDSEIKQIELSNMIGANSLLWVKGLQGEQLTPEEEVKFETIVHAVTVKYDSMWDRANRQLSTRTDGIARQFALHVYANPGFRRVWLRRCEYYKVISSSEIPPCERIKVELKKIEDGELAPPQSYMWSL